MKRICCVPGSVPVFLREKRKYKNVKAGLACLHKQGKFRNSVYNYILKFVTDNEDQRRDQGVSKFELIKVS